MPIRDIETRPEQALAADLAEKTRQLAEANQDLELLAAAMSHDLRAPVRHISSFAELLAEHLADQADSPSKHDLDVITKEAAEMNAMIDRLVDWARIGSAGISVGRVDLNALVRDVIDALTSETAGRSIEWDIGELPAVCGDVALLQTALACVVSNALKFTRPQPLARIKIVLEPQTAGSGQVVVSVQDNGVGFPGRYHEKIYDLMQKMHNQAAFEGVGMGLAIARRIMRKLGGHIWAVSELNQGAMFYLELPRYIEQ
jgi:light-regulated signal transduction histidine kinase (bacteriophytochrome)